MKARFVSRLISQPWHINSARGRTIIGSMLLSLMRNERPEKDIFGDPLPSMRVVGDCAIIPISGVLMLSVPQWIKEWGFNVTDPNDIEQELTRALNDPLVSMVVLHIDSPGGESIAGEKMYDLTEMVNKKKPVFSYAGDGEQMCSSAYQAAAPSLAVMAGKFAEIGCIGTYMMYLDDSAYWEQLGLVWETFRSGELKGIDGKLTDEQRAYFERLVAEYGGRFRSGVSKYRTLIQPADMEGQSFRGIDAAGKGFCSGIAKDLDTAIAKARKML